MFAKVIIMMFLLGAPANAEEGNPTEQPTTEEVAPTEGAEEVAPIPTEKVTEVEGAKEAVEKVDEKKAEVPEDYNQAVETVSALVKAIQSKNWPVVAGLILMLLVFMANKFGLKDKVGPKAIPWVSLAVGVFATSGIALASGVAVMEAIIQGLGAGLAAVGSWETLFKHVLGGSASAE